MPSIADNLLEQARKMTESAVSALQLQSGNPTTTVVPGYPYTVVSAESAKPEVKESPEVDPFTPYYRFVSPDRVQFFPGDPMVRAMGSLCYSPSNPKFQFSRSTRQFFFLKIVIDLVADLQCSQGIYLIRNPTSLMVRSLDIEMTTDIPVEVLVSEVRDPCGGSELSTQGLQLPGTYTLYSPLLVTAPGDTGVVLRPLGDDYYANDEFGSPLSESQYYQTTSPVSWDLARSLQLESGPGSVLGGGYFCHANLSVGGASVIDAPE